ncbi:hypothetical protein [Brucella anthropi]|uniref:hypothetical protein n=1 Tax=Brucella anthropi TaxID=529 RepID=UPI0039864F3D
MRGKFLLGAGLLLALTACTTNRIPEQFRTDHHMGEARYFQSRCPQYKAVDAERAVFVYCMANKAYNRECNPQQTARSFIEGSLDGYKSAKLRYQNVPDKKVCSIAESKYGVNGSEMKQLLKR